MLKLPRPASRPAIPSPTGGNAFRAGTIRTIRGTLKRFVALATITALGVTMLTGLKAACVDLRNTADTFFDEQNLFDVRVMSTLGLTSEDIDALAALDGVDAVEGGWTETVYTQVGASSEKVDVKALSPTGMNAPVVTQGHLPERDDQVAVTERFLKDSGLMIGDTITFHGAADAEDAESGSEDDLSADAISNTSSTEVFERKEYTIIATVLDPQDVNAGEGTMSFRSAGGSQYAFFVLDSCVIDPSVYTVAYISVAGADEPLCYDGTYNEIVDTVKQSVEDARAERELARGAGLRADAHAQVDEAEAEAEAQLADAEAELDSAQATIDANQRSINAGQDELNAGRAELDSAAAELAQNEPAVRDGLVQIAAGLGCSVDGIPAAIADRQAQIDSGAAQLASARSQITSSAQMLASIAGDAWPASAWNRLVNASSVAEAEAAAAEIQPGIERFVSEGTAAIAQINRILAGLGELADSWANLPAETQSQIDAILNAIDPTLAATIRQILTLPYDRIISGLENLSAQLGQLTQLAPGMVEIVRGEVELEAGRAQLQQARDGYNQLANARDQIASGWDQVESGRAELASGQAELDRGQAELDRGQAELDEGRATFESERADARAQIADARDAVDEIPNATWYVQDRSSLSSYASVDSDASSIEAIGTVIPLVFFVVAVLISLTTMTRMVEEERGLIGLYKALGYSRRRILSKYVLYALAACVAGGIVGLVAGYVVLPAIIFTIFKTMYALPGFIYGFDPVWAAGAVALFAAGIVGATAFTCVSELRETPASLMRPKAPRAGSRILLEHIRPIWSRLGFLNKVTARNLFRYKRRLLMTVFGVAGCVALLITGFGIRDTVLSLPERQYGDAGVVAYDLMAVSSADDLDGVAGDLEADERVADLTRAYIDSLTVTYGDAKETVQLIVVPDGTDLTRYLHLTDTAGSALELGTTGAIITVNAEQVLGFGVGDTLELQDSTLATGSTTVDAIALNYLSNMIFMSQDAYAQAFGTTCEPNGVLAHLSGAADEQIAFSEELTQDARLLSVVSTQKLVRDFSGAFTLINTVVYVVIVLAAALAFTVVFTLSNTNISERERELATIKVLGFRAREVHRYINKETILLTLMGIVAGMPLGYALARSLTWILKMPSLYFDVVVDPVTYVISGALALVFTLMVNRITNRALDRVDMVGALKSAE